MRVLIAEDDRVSREMLLRLVSQWGHEAVASADGQEAWAALQRDDAPQLAVLDWTMPGLDGIEVCRRARELASDRYVYVIMLTSRAEQEHVVEGIDAGADDYMIKPFDLDELRVRLRAGERIVELQNELLEAQHTLRRQASHDGLTGVWNRSAIMDILQSRLKESAKRQSPLGVMMVDLDHFKRVNDTYGHVAGDVVLRETAQRLARSLRRDDEVGRYGGEEFLAVLPGCDLELARRVGERTRQAVAANPVDTPEGPIAMTASLGVAAAEGGAVTCAEDLIRAADAALYDAKRAGRDRVVVAPVLTVPPDRRACSEPPLAETAA